MRLSETWPLAFLLLIPAIVLLYLLKERPKEREVSSLYLWQSVYRSLQANAPWERLRKSLLMALQILVMALLTLALAGPYLAKGGEGAEAVFLVIDRSGSMGSEFYEDGKDARKTRLEAAKEKARAYVDAALPGARVTVIAGGADSEVILSGSADERELKRAIDSIEGTDERGDLSDAVNLVSSMAASWERSHAVFFTDESLDLGDVSGLGVSLASEGSDGAIDLVSHERGEDGSMTVLVRVANRGGVFLETDLGLYLDGELWEVREVALGPGKSESLYFEGIPADARAVMAELGGKDDLEGDDRGYDVLLEAGKGRVLLVSERNVFLEKALAALPDVELYKTTDKEAASEGGYDLYVFDGVVPDALPEEGNLLFLHPTEGAEGLFAVEGEAPGDWVSTEPHEATAYLEDFSFGANAIDVIEKPKWADSFLAYGEEGRSAGFVGRTGGRVVGVLAFDLHESDLPLRAEFPILMHGLVGQCLAGSLVGEASVAAGEPVTVYSKDLGEEISVFLDGEKVASLDGGEVEAQFAGVSRAGIYEVRQRGESASFAANFPREESDCFGKEALFAGTRMEEDGEVPEGARSLRVPILALLLLALAAELAVSARQGAIPRGDKARRRWILGLEGAVAALALLAIWNPSARLGSQGTTTVFLADVSDSVSGSREEERDFVREALALLPRGDKAAVAAFGEDLKVEQFVSDKALFQEFETLPTTTATNLENAVRGALGLFPEEEGKRLVLLTDGNENAGSLKDAAQAARASGASLLIRKLPFLEGEEALVDEVRAPERVGIGDAFQVEVTVESNTRTSATLSLYAGSERRGERRVTLEPGSNRFVFQDTQEAEGLQSYRVLLEADKDTESANNEAVTFTRAETAGSVLLVEGEPGTSGAMEAVLEAANIRCRLVTPDGAPRTLSGMCRYKSIVLLDVHADDLPEGFLGCLETYVRDYAGGLVAIGGDNSFALGNYKGTPLEETLPVYMDLRGEKEVPKMAVALVIDRSGSMSAENGRISQLSLAKEAAAEALGTLRPTDEIGVVAFESTYEWVVPMQGAGNTEEIEDAIYSIGLGGGTSIYPAMRAAAEALGESDAKIRHVILLTDGQDGFSDYAGLLEEMAREGITLSTVAVGDRADKKLLGKLAKKGGGRAYLTDAGTDIPRIFAKEMFLSVDAYLVNEEFEPIRAGGSDLLGDVAAEGLPTLLGYVASTKKELATAHLTSARGDPILTSWQYGLGKTVAFNSDGENKWTAHYADWEEYPQFWKNIIEYTMAEESETAGEIQTRQEGGRATVTYRAKEYGAGTSVDAVVTDEKGEGRKVSLEPTAPGVFEGSFDAREPGVYSVSVTQREGGEASSTENTAVAVQYSMEYRLAQDARILEDFAEETGAAFIDGSDEVFEREARAAHAMRPLAPYFLTAAIVLFLACVVLKRIDPRRVAAAWRERRAGRVAARDAIGRDVAERGAAGRNAAGRGIAGRGAVGRGAAGDGITGRDAGREDALSVAAEEGASLATGREGAPSAMKGKGASLATGREDVHLAMEGKGASLAAAQGPFGEKGGKEKGRPRGGTGKKREGKGQGREMLDTASLLKRKSER